MWNPSSQTVSQSLLALQVSAFLLPLARLLLRVSARTNRSQEKRHNIFFTRTAKKRKKMACLQLARSSLVPSFRSFPRHRCVVAPPAFHVNCRLDGDNNGEEPPESLFMKELKRRGMTPGSLLEKDIAEAEEGTDSKAGPTSGLEFEKGISDQRKRSMALNSEGIEGLIPRAKLLLSIGSTFFLGFWPLITVTFGLFAILYFYFGPSFIHDASKTPISPPPYIDPYKLLEDERLSEAARM